MSTLLTNIGTVITSLVSWLGTVATALIGNEVFQIMLAIVLFTLFFGLMVGLAKGVKGRKKRK